MTALRLVAPATSPIGDTDLDEYMRWAKDLRGLRPTTLRVRRELLERLRVHLGKPLRQATEGDLLRWEQVAVAGRAPETRRAYVSHARAFYRWGHATGRVRVDPAADLPAVRHPRALPRPVPDTVIVAALDGADDRQRDAIELGAITGLRRSEIARARTGDLVRRPDGWWLRVAGKGGVERDVPLPDDLGDRLASRPRGWLFPNGRGGHLTPAYLGRLMRGRLSDSWTPHTLRHRFASTAYAAERDYRAVQELLGHANVNTTMIYTAVPEGARRAAVMAAAVLGTPA